MATAPSAPGRPPTPETSYLEQYDILVQNDVDQPRINREAVSRRRLHRTVNGHYTAPLDDNGKPQKRTGFMVPCSTTRTATAVRRQLMTGISYVCTPNPLFYTFHIINESLTEEARLRAGPAV